MTLPNYLSAKYEESFAYDTVKSRMPVILTKVIDTCYKQISVNLEKYGEEGAEDGKDVVGQLSKLRNHLMTDKPYVDLDDGLPDRDKWNESLEERRQAQQPTPPSPFTSPWLFAECFMYRQIAGILQKSKYLQSFDPFQEQKDVALENALPGLRIIAGYLSEFLKSSTWKEDDLQSHFETFLKVSLWSNRFDLSLSAGQENEHKDHDPVATLHELEDCLLIDDFAAVYRHLQDLRSKGKVRVDFVIDNAGFEFCSDLMLIDFLLCTGLANEIHVHTKNVPWFVSDVNKEDVERILQRIGSDEGLHATCGSLREKIAEKKIVFVERRLAEYWSLWRPFSEMQKRDPELYKYLSGSGIIIFKGDLNFRKLVGDLQWSSTTKFRTALQGFSPAPLCALRTLKADVVVGLEAAQAEKVAEVDVDWMVSGKYAVVQFEKTTHVAT